jgi:hypothetical protein
MKILNRALTVAALTLLATTFASGQLNNIAPRDGACFFTDYSYRGQSFCVTSGRNEGTVPSGFNDRIRSIRVYGGAQVQYFNNSNFSGASGFTSSDIGDLRRLSVPDAPNKNWSGRISSVRIAGTGYGRGGNDQGNNDRGSWNQDNRGNRRHDQGNHGDNRGGWNQGHNGRDHDSERDSDHDRNDGYGSQRNYQANVSCSSSLSSNREWCKTQSPVNSARLVNENGQVRCELNRTFGVDNGRLWTARGCSGHFELR